MSIFQPRVSSPAAETPESLAELLTNAEVQRTAAVREANLIFEADKAYVVEQAETRVRAIDSLLDDLAIERNALNGLLFPAGSDSLDDQA